MEKSQILAQLLRERNEHPERKKQIDKQIEGMLKVKKAVYIQDMSGFSRLVIKYGIIHYLAMIQQMQDLVIPVIIKNKGSIVKTEADNVFATFNNVNDAIKSAKEVMQRLHGMNVVLPDERDLNVSIGIGFGDILLLDHDFFGNEVNLASKLGEDIAEKNQILITSEACKKYSKKTNCKKVTASISGVNLIYYDLKY